MAAGWLLSSDGATLALNDSAWQAAYDYYGHDETGIEYADVVDSPVARPDGRGGTIGVLQCCRRRSGLSAIPTLMSEPFTCRDEGSA